MRILHGFTNVGKCLLFDNYLSNIVRYYTKLKKNNDSMKVLNVAEKNDAAKNIASILGRGNCRRREGFSVYNKIYEFNLQLWNKNCTMIMTSVSGHLLTYEFIGSYRGWNNCHPSSLFDAPVRKACPENFTDIKRTLEREIQSCGALVIWTDCDREGENIGYEIITVCQAIKSNIKVYRATFSEITAMSIHRALQTLGEPNKLISDAVDVRSELDLRIGAAFTRFQTLRLKRVFPQTLADMLISYGSCQFPTLGFVVERYLAIERFVPEPYWKIKVTDARDELSVEFRWARNRLFEKLPCQVFLDICLENPEATVEKIVSKPKSKWRPVPLDTIELEKQGSRKLRLNAKQTMKIAEKLYTQGLISYPRTETNIFPKELNLVSLVTPHTEHPIWGEFVSRLLQDGINPRQGKKSDQAHPPIHPTKYTNSLQGNEAKVYEFVVRHFLACLSKNAEGYETIVNINIAGENFVTNGLQIIAKNYLEVYIYEKWNAKEIHIYEQGQKFRPTDIVMLEESTSAPNLLTEADLIALMDKHGIGTDATHAEHIDTIKSRHYVGMQDDKHLIPGKLGIGLVMGYDNMGFQMSKPHLRAELERDLKLICEGRKDAKEVLQYQISQYREVFRVAMEKANLIDSALAQYLDEAPTSVQDLPATILSNNSDVIFKCPKCGSNMTLRDKRQGTGKFISCMAYPTCKNAIWFPETVEEVQVLNESCRECQNDIKKLKFKLKRNAFSYFGTSYTACINCDTMFSESLGINNSCIRRTEQHTTVGNEERANDTGYESMQNTQSTQPRNPSKNETVRLINSTQRSNVPRPITQNSNLVRITNSSDIHNRAASNQNYSINNSNPGTMNTTNNIARNTNTSVRSSNEVVMCNCHENAVQLTVKKEGPNKGRLFYKCAKPQGSGCTFFLWATDDTVLNNSIMSNNTSSTNNDTRNANISNSYSIQQWNAPSARNTGTNNSHNSQQWNQNAPSSNSNWNNDPAGDQVLCSCGEPSRRLTVQKDTPNKGRQFYTCMKGQSGGCNFFKWADEITGDDTWQPGPSRGRGRGGGRGRGQGDGSKKPRAPGGKRKCGICGIEGHTRKTCPQNSMD